MPQIKIEVRNNQLFVTPPSQPLSKRNAEEAEWVCDQDFCVCFAGRTPFASNHFFHASSTSGEPVGPHGTYKYSVEVGHLRVDPDIIVRD